MPFIERPRAWEASNTQDTTTARGVVGPGPDRRRNDAQANSTDGRAKKLTGQLLLTGGNIVISLKGGIPKNWEKPFCFYY
jgi:hypothetical protein